MELAPLHVKVCDLHFQAFDVIRESVGDETAFYGACDYFVEAIEANARSDFVDEYK